MGGSDNWTVIEGTNTKSFDHAGLMNEVLAAEKGSEFIKQWLDETLLMLSKPKDMVIKLLTQCGVTKDRFIDAYTMEALPSDVASCVLGQKHAQLTKEKKLKSLVEKKDE